MKKLGRPTGYDPSFCERVIELGREGKGHAQIAAALDVCRMSLYRWQSEHPSFSDAMTRARDLSQAWFEDMGQAGLTMPGFNASLWAKQVSCRYPDDYREVTRQELTGKNGEAIKSESQVSVRPSITREEWIAAYVDTPARTAVSSD